MRTKNNIKANSNSRGQGKLDYSETNRMVSTLKRKAAVIFSEEEALDRPIKSKPKKKKLGRQWSYMLNQDPTIRLLNSYVFNGHKYQAGSKIVWDWMNVKGYNNQDNFYTSREGWQYRVIKFIAENSNVYFL